MSALRSEYILKTDAQTFADKIHAWMISNIPHYARSVLAGQTLRWAIPYQDEVPTVWGVNVKDRCIGSLTAPEVSALKSIPTASVAV